MELLVVIAVIALLMALLMPGLRKAIEAARVSVCASNLDQIHTAIHIGIVGREHGRLPTTTKGEMIVGPAPNIGGYRGNQFGFHAHELNDLGWTFKVGLCPSLAPDAGGTNRRGAWWTRREDGVSGQNGSDYLYTGGRSDHPGGATTPEEMSGPDALGYPRFGFEYGKPGGIYFSTDRIYSGTYSVDDDGNTYRDETYPSEVIYVGDIAYNGVGSYAQWYHGYVDPSNHQDTSVQDHKSGNALWPAIGRGSNRMKADGSVEWWNFPVKGRGKGGKMSGSYVHDYYAAYY